MGVGNVGHPSQWGRLRLAQHRWSARTPAQPDGCLGEERRGLPMTDVQVGRALNSVGMGCFVKYFRLFADESLSRQYLIELLARDKNYTRKASGTRVSHARRIIRAGRARDALALVAEAAKVPEHIRIEAKELCVHSISTYQAPSY